MSCVKGWFINYTGSISIGSSGNEMPRNYHLNLFDKYPMIVIAGHGL